MADVPRVSSVDQSADLIIPSGFGIIDGRAVDRYRSKAELAADSLRHAIATGKIKRGERLRFSDLIDELGMSATPIREALRILATEGLVSMESHRAIRVAEFSAEDAQELYEVRAMLESYATRLAVPRLPSETIAVLEQLHERMKSQVDMGELSLLPGLNARWHHSIYAMASSKYLHFEIRRLWVWFPWDIWLIPDRACASMDEHGAILEAIRKRDAELAADRMRDHILSGRHSVVGHLREAESGREQEPAVAES